LLGSPLCRCFFASITFFVGWVEERNPTVYCGLNPTYKKTKLDSSFRRNDDITKNKILIGNLGKDPEIRYLPTSGAAVANFTLATNRYYNNKQGQKVDETEWHRIVVYGHFAEVCGEHLHRGSLVSIEGRLKTGTWEDKEGRKHSVTEIITESLKMLGKKNGQSNGFQEGGRNEITMPECPSGDDEIPF
jgi:single-strand DNA-binding protein